MPTAHPNKPHIFIYGHTNNSQTYTNLTRQKKVQKMLFAVTYKGDNDKLYKLVFTSTACSHHFKIDTEIPKSELADLIEHAESDCKSFTGNTKVEQSTDNITKPEKKRYQFILFRHLARKKTEKETKEYRTDMEDINKRNKKTIKEMLESPCENFRVYQSLSLPSSDSVDDFYNEKKESTEPEPNNHAQKRETPQ